MPKLWVDGTAVAFVGLGVLFVARVLTVDDLASKARRAARASARGLSCPATFLALTAL